MRQPLYTLVYALLLGVVLAMPPSSPGLARETAPTGIVPAGTPVAPPPITRPPRLIVAERVETTVRIDQVEVDVEIHGSQALTRIEMHLANPNARVLEGELRFPLLDGQQVVGMALDIDGKLRPAVPVEKAKGRQVFDDVARRAVDPALLEKTLGDNYGLRVYPIPARGGRRAVLHILENLPGGGGELHYGLPVAWADKLDSFTLRLRVFGAQARPVALPGPLGEPLLARRGEVYEMTVERRAFAGQGMFALRLPAPSLAQAVSQRFAGATYFRAEIPAPEPAPAQVAARRPAARVALYWDASGSAVERDMAREFSVLERYFQAMGNGEATLIAFRDSPEAARVFPIVDGDWRSLREALRALPRDGATRVDNLPRVVGVGEALLVGDGLANYGTRKLADLGVPIYTLASSPSADHAALRRWAHASGGRHADLTRLDETHAARAWLTHETRVTDMAGEGVRDLLVEAPVPEAGRFVVAGIASGEQAVLRLALRLPDGSARRVEVAIPKPQDNAMAALAWARLKLAELDGEHAVHRAEIQRLGRLFGLPSRETSLIVLDRVEDYAQHGIEPPEALRADYARLRAGAAAAQAKSRAEHLERVVAQFKGRVAWWEKDFPKDAPPAVNAKKATGFAGAVEIAEAARPVMAAPSMPMRERADAPAMARAAAPLAGGAPGQAAPEAASTDGTAPAIQLKVKPWSADAPYVARLKEAPAADRYRVYLDLLPDWRAASAFYLDAAEVFFAAGERALALRILSNLAEMNLENRELLRILGYRLTQAEEPGLAIPVFEEVARLAPDEPQSYRDLGLAHAQAGQGQKAVDLLWETVARPWDGRFPDIEMTALAELNALLATSKEPLDSRAVDARLRRNLPLDARVVLNWDTDNTDIDLWVTDPNGEKAYYGHPLTYQGGRMSRDFTGGYGPEEFALKHAKPGTYRIQAHFFGNRRQVLSGATTLSVKLYSHFGTPRQTEKLLTLRLDKARDAVDIGDFEVGARR